MSDNEEEGDQTLDAVIDRFAWNLLVEDSHRALDHRVLIILNASHFTSEKGNRYTVKNTALKYLKIFPWFQHGKPKARYRETLKSHKLETVLEAINYFLNDRNFLPNDIQFLINYYLEMEIPVENPLTKIIELKFEFEQHLLVTEIQGRLSFSIFDHLLDPPDSLSLLLTVSPSLFLSFSPSHPVSLFFRLTVQSTPSS
jgi:hypothetical protein